VPPPPGKTPPTTLGASAGQVAAPSLPPGAPARRSGTLGWVMMVAVLLGAAGIAVAVVATRSDGTHAAGGTHDAGAVARSAPPDAAQPAVAIDAGVTVATTPGAAAPDAALPVDAALPPPVDAALPPPVDAPVKRPHRPHGAPQPHAGSSTTPPGCDRSIDTDCDGIPDVR
jgi:hypothetical protein